METTSILVQTAIVAAVFGVLWLALVRPQQQRLRRHREMLAALRPGDRIATSGGLVGRIVGVGGGAVIIEIAEGVRVEVLRERIDSVLGAARDPVARTTRGGEHARAA